MSVWTDSVLDTLDLHSDGEELTAQDAVELVYAIAARTGIVAAAWGPDDVALDAEDPYEVDLTDAEWDAVRNDPNWVGGLAEIAGRALVDHLPLVIRHDGGEFEVIW